jgi:hypothetical protein
MIIYNLIINRYFTKKTYHTSRPNQKMIKSIYSDLFQTVNIKLKKLQVTAYIFRKSKKE